MSTKNQANLTHTIGNTFIDNIDDLFFRPALKNAVTYDCMIGYFNSSSFQVIAKSLLVFLRSDIQSKMRFIISPNLSKSDLKILM